MVNKKNQARQLRLTEWDVVAEIRRLDDERKTAGVGGEVGGVERKAVGADGVGQKTIGADGVGQKVAGGVGEEMAGGGGRKAVGVGGVERKVGGAGGVERKVGEAGGVEPMIGTDGVVQMELGEAELGKVDGVKKLEKVKPPAKKEMVVNHWRSPRRKTPLATHLKLAQFAGRFYRYSYTMTLKFTKVHRELLGEDIIRRVSRILDKTVEIANYANRVNRQRLLRELEDMNRCFPMMIKLAHEQRCISDNNFSAWGKMVAELQDMTIGWVMELDKKEAEERNKKKKETLAERAKKLDEVKAAKLGAVEGAKGAGLKMQVKAEG